MDDVPLVQHVSGVHLFGVDDRCGGVEKDLEKITKSCHLGGLGNFRFIILGHRLIGLFLYSQSFIMMIFNEFER